MKYGLLNRMILIMIILLVHIAFFLMIAIVANFIIDSPNYNLDVFKLTRLSKNFNFCLCTYLECRTKYKMTLFIDACNTFLVFCQSLFFSNKKMREILLKNTYLSTNYYAIFVPKLIAYFSVLMTAMLFQPTAHMNYFIFDSSNYFNPFLLYLPILIAFLMIVSTLKFHYYSNDELGGCLLIKLILNKEIEEPMQFLFGRETIYHNIRSPFRGGVMIFMLFSNPKWEIGRLIYTSLFFLLCYAECVNEEHYYYNKHDVYKKYMRSVKNRFITLLNYSIKKVKIE